MNSCALIGGRGAVPGLGPHAAELRGLLLVLCLEVAHGRVQGPMWYQGLSWAGCVQGKYLSPCTITRTLGLSLLNYSREYLLMNH